MVVEWREALADAGVDEAECHLITCPGAPVTGYAKAVIFAKGTILNGAADEGGIVVTAAKLKEANDDANVWRHRIAVLEDIDSEDENELAYVAGVLRHEIEHAKQREKNEEAFGLTDLVRQVVGLVESEDSERYRDLINSSPIEADANAAAARYVRERYAGSVSALMAGPDHYLVDATAPPGDPSTLIRRTVDFLWQFRDICDDPARLPDGRGFADILESNAPGFGAGALWREPGRAPA